MPGRQIAVAFRLDSRSGGEAALSFGLSFDPKAMSFVRADLGADTQGRSVLTVNAADSAKGELGMLIDGPAAMAAGGGEIVRVTFDVPTGTGPGDYPVAFSTDVVHASTSDEGGHLLVTKYEGTSVSVRTPGAGKFGWFKLAYLMPNLR